MQSIGWITSMASWLRLRHQQFLASRRRLTLSLSRSRRGNMIRRIEGLEDRTLMAAAVVTLSSSANSFAEDGGSATVSANLTSVQDHDVFVKLDLGGSGINNVGYRATTNAAPITIDGNFSDWTNNPNIVFGSDPANDTHDTDTTGQNNTPVYVSHPDVDLQQFAVTHDDQNLYFYFKSAGQIGRTQVADPSKGKAAGRYYVIVTADVDQNDSTGYSLDQGGYYPTTTGYDVNSEIEFYNGTFNTGNYLNHGATDLATLNQAFADQSQNGYNPALASQDTQGPFNPGFMRVIPGTYKYYTEWVYQSNDPNHGGTDSITFVKDKGPVVDGIIKQALSADGHELEMIVPYKGFLVDQFGNSIVSIGKTLDLSFSLEASGELAPGGQWASDTANPLNGYNLTASSQTSINEIRIPAGQLSASITITGQSDTLFNPNRNATVQINNVVGAIAGANQPLSLAIVNNDPPTITTTSSVLRYTIASPPIAIDPELKTLDSSTSNYTGATVKIGSTFVAGQDVLDFTSQSGITGSFNPNLGILTLTGTASSVAYQNALRSVTYRNSSSNPTGSNRTITFQVTGGGLSGSASRTVGFSTIIAPVIGSFDTPIIYIENKAGITLDTNVTVASNTPNFDLGQLTVQLTANGESTDLLEVRNQGTTAGQIGVNGANVTFGGTIIGILSGGIGTAPLVITFNSKATTTIVQALLRNVTYRSLSENPSFATRTVKVTLTDGTGGTSNQPTKIIDVTPVNDIPVISDFGGSLSYTEDGPPILVAAGAGISDADSANFDTGKLIVRVMTNAQTSDLISIRHQGTNPGQIGVNGSEVSYGGISIGTFSGTSLLIVTLNVNANSAAVQALLRNITYSNTSQAPSTLTRTISATLSDGDGGTSQAVTMSIAVTALNDAPVIGAFDSAITYIENAAPVLLDSDATVVDPDLKDFDQGVLTVSLMANAHANDRLSIRNQGTAARLIGTNLGTITYGGVNIGTFTGGTSGEIPLVITFNAAAYQAAVQAVVRNLTFSNVSDNPTTLPRSIRLQLTDGDGGTSTTASKTINITAVNDAPVVSGFSGSLSYTEDGPPVLIAVGAGITDADSVNFDTGKLIVRVMTNAQTTDLISIRNQGTNPGEIGVSGNNVTYGGTVIGTFAGTTSLTVTLNADADSAAVQALLRNITYQNLSHAPSTLTRTISASLSDGDGGTSLIATTAVAVTAVNDVPVIGAFDTAITYTPNAVPVLLDSNATVVDPDLKDFDQGTLTVLLTANGHADDRLSIRNQGTTAGLIGTNLGTITFGGVNIGTFTGGTSGTIPLVITFNAAAYQAAVQAVIRNLTFSNISNSPTTLPRSVQLQLTDGDGGTSATVSKTINVTGGP